MISLRGRVLQLDDECNVQDVSCLLALTIECPDFRGRPPVMRQCLRDDLGNV